METEDLAKRLEWLEREYRKDHSLIAELQEQIAGYENAFQLLRNQIKEVGADIARFSSTAARLDQFDTMVTQYRGELTKSIDEVEKRRLKHEREMDDRRRVEQENINRSLLDLRAALDVLPEFRRGIQGRVDEDTRLSRAITEIEKKLTEFTRADEDIRRTIRMGEDVRKQEAKRVVDIQGDIAAIRKRSEEAREKSDLNQDNLRQLDARINEILVSEAERRNAQVAFIEQQSLAQLDRDRAWKEMQARFESFNRQTSGLDQQILSLEETQRSVKRSQEAFEDINIRLERRINEITEIQRLAEERFRQEWVSFKADDQKRWTNYSLTQDELTKNIRVELEKLVQRIAELDDAAQVVQDTLQQTSQVTETHLQGLMNWTHDFLSNYERTIGRPRLGK